MLTRLLAHHGRTAMPWFTADEACGVNPGLRTWLDEQNLNYVMAVSCDTRFATRTGPRRADALAACAPHAAGNASRPAGAAKDTGFMTGYSSIPVPMRTCCWCAARSPSPTSWPITSAAGTRRCHSPN